MNDEKELNELIEEFFDRTCITKYIFEKNTNDRILRMSKKTPVGNWTIKSVEIGYFINMNDDVVITILSKGMDSIHQKVERILLNRAQRK
ncbi:MAG: hypothetical protein ACTSRS_05025 [Candidatus Helarchaeota archaeon]